MEFGNLDRRRSPYASDDLWPVSPSLFMHTNTFTLSHVDVDLPPPEHIIFLLAFSVAHRPAYCLTECNLRGVRK